MMLRTRSMQPLDMRAAVERAKANADALVRAVLLETMKRIIERSPVGDPSYWQHPAPPGYVGGTFRGAWQYGMEAAPGAMIRKPDADGSATLAALVAALPVKAAGHRHFVVNNLPYARRIEYGWSQRQAPAGVVGITAAEMRNIIDASAMQVKEAA